MKIFYSPRTRGLYGSDTHSVIPDDAVEIPEQQYQALLAARGLGKEIVTGADGFPVAASPVAETWDAAYERALGLLRSERAGVLSILDGLQTTASSKGLAALLAGDAAAAGAASELAGQVEALKQGLKDATTAIAFDQCATFEDMRQAGKAYYAQLVQGAPADVVRAFAEVV